ncbi:MAG TPA: hypothetical protein PK295_01635 [Candidatus Magasanikbacteria bacterium]|nr:hypothetical protein [Candidatus Magasanikbacteria bacterium]
MIAKLSEKFNTRIVILIISAFLLLGEAYLYTFPIISTIAFISYVMALGKMIGERISEKKDIQWWAGIAIALSMLSLIGIIAYYPYRLTIECSMLAVFSPLLLLFKKKKPSAPTKTQTFKRPGVLFSAFSILECAQVALILFARNGELMQSPWMAFSPWFFALFTVSTSIYLYLLVKKTAPQYMLGATIVHFFIFYSIAAIVYKLGFGFDGFIHRATESWILENGFITPKEPFYLGQYSLVVTLSRITGITIKYIDIFLVPILASLSIPTLIYSVIPKAWSINKHTALSLSLFVPFIFFLSFNLTTPHNLALLITLLTIIALVGYTEKILPYSLVLILALIALATHPLLGVPLVIVVVASKLLAHVENKKIQRLTYAGIILSTAAIPLLMFVTQQWLGGYGIPELTNPFSHIQLFLDFFRRPFWYTAHAAWYFELLYAWQYVLTPVVLIFSACGYWFLRKTKLAPLLLSGSVGLVAGAFLLRTLITFPNVSFHEQSNYPLRLLIGSIVLLIPLGMYGIYKISKEKLQMVQEKLPIKPAVIYIIGSIKIGVLLMLSLYFSYPQYNSKVYFPGFNVTKYDQQVVDWIDSENSDTNYAVLSSILTAVTALTEHPFAYYFDTSLGPQFYYSIPSGGPLQLAYESMLYEGQKKETIDTVFELTKAEKIYFVVPWYWKNHEAIIDGAKKTANSWHSIEDKMWIFEYRKN